MNAIDTIIEAVKNRPESVEFSAVMAAIDSSYQHKPTNFTCGAAVNTAGTNEGSCKILAFAKIQNFSEDQALSLFGSYYREDVLKHPDGCDHANIRNFMISGWAGVSFDGDPLTPI